jgi:hypothetical protein
MANILSQTVGGGYIAVEGCDLRLLHGSLEPKARSEDFTAAVAADLMRAASGAPTPRSRSSRSASG